MMYVVDIDYCSPDPCVHGSCTDGLLTCTCNCDHGWTGNTCSTGMSTYHGKQQILQISHTKDIFYYITRNALILHVLEKPLIRFMHVAVSHHRYQ